MRTIKVPTEEASALIAADAKLRAAKLRIKELESQRDEALARVEQARRAVHPVPIAPAKRKPRVRGDRVRIVFGDAHGLHVDRAAFSALLADMRRFDPHEIILGGDMINCGGFLAQQHTLGFVADTAETYEDDVAAANGLLDSIAAAAPRARIEYLEGNHEDRVERWAVTHALRNSKDADFLRRLVSPHTLLGLKARGIQYFRRTEHHDGISVPGWIRRGKIYFTHEISSARNAASSAVANSGGNIVYFHTHRTDCSTLDLPGVGLIAAWCPGCLCRRQPLWRHTKPTHWTHGYAVQFVARSGEFIHVNVPITEGRSLVGGLLK